MMGKYGEYWRVHFIEICMSESGPVDPAKLATPVKKEKKHMESPEKPAGDKPAVFCTYELGLDTITGL